MEKENKMCMKGSGTSGAVYGLGFIGAAIYFISHAPDFLTGLVGVAKAIVWPAFLVYEIFKYSAL